MYPLTNTLLLELPVEEDIFPFQSKTLPCQPLRIQHLKVGRRENEYP